MADEVIREGQADFEVVDFADLTEDQRSLDEALKTGQRIPWAGRENLLSQHATYLVVQAFNLYSILITGWLGSILVF